MTTIVIIYWLAYVYGALSFRKAILEIREGTFDYDKDISELADGIKKFEFAVISKPVYLLLIVLSLFVFPIMAGYIIFSKLFQF